MSQLSMMKMMFRAGQRRAARQHAQNDLINFTTTALSSIGSGIQHTIIDATLSTPAQIWTYVVGNKYPIGVPSVDACLRSWMTGWLSTVDTAAVCRWQGADVPLPGRLRDDAALGEDSLRMQRAWLAALDQMQSVVTTEGCLELWLRGQITDIQLQEWLRRNGVINDEVREALKVLTKAIPGVEDVVPAWQTGLISNEEARTMLARRGVDLDVFAPLWQADSVTLSPDEAIEYGLRGGADRNQLDELMLRTGVSDASQRDAMLTLYARLPSRGDVQTWLMRNVFDEQYVNDFRLDEGFEDRYWARFGTVLTAGGWSKDYAYLDYAAHWQIPAISQLAEMVQRLRPGRVPDELAFTRDDFLRVLAEQDVAPYYRERLLATSYRPLPIRFLRAAYQTDALTQAGVAEAYQDQGYAPEVAAFMAETERLIKARARAAASRGWTPAAIAHAVVTNQTTAEQANFLMHELGFSTAETTNMLERAQAEYAGRFVTAGASRVASSTVRAVLRGYTVGTVSAGPALTTLVSLGWREDSARAVLAATELEVKTNQVVRAVAAVRRAFLKGDVSTVGALALLARAGMDTARAQSQVAAWQLELTPARRHVSAGAIRKGVLAGVLSVEQARAALANLGYSDPDATLLVSEMTYDLRQQEVKLKKASDKNRVSAARIYDQLLAKNASLERKIRGRLKSVTPIAKLQAWLGSGLIDEAYFRHRMSQMGYGDDTIERYLADALAKHSKKSGGPPPASPGNGQAAPPGP